MVLVHLAPFFVYGFVWGAVVLIISYIVGGGVSGFLLGLAIASPDWPDRFLLLIGPGPFILALIAILLSAIAMLGSVN